MCQIVEVEVEMLGISAKQVWSHYEMGFDVYIMWYYEKHSMQTVVL